MRVLLAQLDPAPGDPAANAATVADVVARHPDADLAVFPELFLTGYDLEAAPGLAVGPDDAALRTVAEAARAAGTAVLVGHIERPAGDGPPFNSVACFDTDGSLAATYRKTHLFGREDEVFAAGDELVLCVLAGRRIAPLVCFDVEFPEPARALARDGAELLVTLSANMDPWGPDHELAARARALDNRLPHVYVNRVGDEAGLHFCGGSLAAGPDGAITTALGGEPGTAVAELDLDASPEDAVDYLRRVRPGLSIAATVPATSRGGS
jgi:predicted amidohydrolase